jgi:hypothetical protein
MKGRTFSVPGSAMGLQARARLGRKSSPSWKVSPSGRRRRSARGQNGMGVGIRIPPSPERSVGKLAPGSQPYARSLKRHHAS